MSQQCPYEYSEGERCSHPVFKDHGYCIFHSPKEDEKKEDFLKELNKYIAQCEKYPEIEEYNFGGFIFPIISFRKKEFLKNADFNASKFSGLADFSASNFSGYADFGGATFSGNAYFNNSKFSEDVYFNESKFSGLADFTLLKCSEDAYFFSSRFSGNTNFLGSMFSGNADFSESKFSGNTQFRDSIFSGNVDFSGSNFSGHADFNMCEFHNTSVFNDASFEKIVNFSSAKFHDDLSFYQSHLTYIKNIEAKNINFENAILEESHFWGIDKIKGYSFKNAFLLSISFAEKEVIGCDFTGGVIDAVRTRGWKPDDATLKNTKFIYTDYTVETVIEDGKERKIYKPIEESRVPADGFFGEGDNEGFTIKEFLLEPYKWSYSVPLPPQIKTAVVNYIEFFTDFINNTAGKEVEIHTRREGQKIRVEFSVEKKEDKQFIEEQFRNYFNNIGKDFSNITFEFRNPDVSEIERDLFKIKYENQINNLRTELKYTTRLLEAQEEKNQLLERFISVIQSNPLNLLVAPQKTERGNFCVLKADVVRFSDFMKHGRGQEISDKLDQIVKHQATNCKYSNVSGGDSLQIVDHDAVLVFKTASRIIEDLSEVPGNPTMRIAIDCGDISFEESQDVFVPKDGSPLRTPARIEPFVKPSEIWVTESFKSMLEKGTDKYEVIELTQNDASELEYKDGMFNVKKKGSPEDDFYIKLYKIKI